MKAEKNNIFKDSSDLRRRAEEKVAQSPKNTEVLLPEEAKRVFHELRVHQIELEMQNEELRRSQAELDASRARYFDLYDLAPVGYFTISEQGLILEANLTATIMLDMPRRSLDMRPFSQFILKDDQDIYYMHRKQLFESREMQAFDMRMLKQDGSPFWVQLDATIAEIPSTGSTSSLQASSGKATDGASVIRVVISDISERKRADEELRRSEARFRSYFDLPSHGIAITSPEKVWLEGNGRLCSMFGYSRDEILRMTWAEMTLPDDLAADVEQFERMLSGQIERYQMEKRFIRKDGNVIWINLGVGCVRQSDGKVDYVIAVLEDITEQKRMKAEKEQLEGQNRQLQKAESLGRMAGAIAHHFNNQLQIVQGYLEMVIAGMPQSDSRIGKLASAMKAAQKVSEVSANLLVYLGQRQVNLKSFDLSELCRLSLPVLQAGIPGNVILETDLPSPGPCINADAKQIQQILSNLLVNAWEGIGDKAGTVHLRVRTVSPADIPVSHRFPVDWRSHEQSYACLEVIDSGCGIQEANIENLFEPFFSTKFTGRGLGLPITIGIVRTHDAVITVENRSNGGSVFKVFFPLSAEKTISLDKQLVETPNIAAGGTVLLVEDDAALREMTGIALVHFGFKVLQARDGVEALEVFGKHKDEISCLLTDLTMPRMGGWETISALRTLRHDLPVILASGYDEAIVMKGVHSELPDFFLNKPYNLDKLRDTIGRAIARRGKREVRKCGSAGMRGSEKVNQ